MWKNIAQALGLSIPEQQLEAISPVLDSLWSQTRQALDRDLSRVDPALTFHPDLGGEA
ncbi:MAG: hypothetical protein HY238_16425 [Acidobacteria bacterium]|nr:hypothetical protein [Acidobacteriota bacterium]